jgi:hypothetical protein
LYIYNLIMDNDAEESHDVEDTPDTPAVPQNFTWAPGQRKDSKLLLFEGKMFMKNQKRDSKTYYSCRKKRADNLTKSFCQAGGYLDKQGMFHYNQKQHL